MAESVNNAPENGQQVAPQQAVARIPNPPAETATLMGASIYLDGAAFASAQRFAGALAASSVVPKAYQNNLANCMVALEYAARTKTSPLMVMQNMHIIDGNPNWSSKFKIAALNSCGRFTPLRFTYGVSGTVKPEWANNEKIANPPTIENMTCQAYATDRETGEKVVGPVISLATAVAEGWYGRKGSKWPNMPQLMLTYRAASMFGNIYATDILLGMQSEEEAYDSQAPYPLQAASGNAGGAQAGGAVVAANAAIARLSDAPQAAPAGEVKRGRGRPPKSETITAATDALAAGAEDATLVADAPPVITAKPANSPAFANPVATANAAITRPAPLPISTFDAPEDEAEETPTAGPNQVNLWDEDPDQVGF